jgi:hypothetical protein
MAREFVTTGIVSPVKARFSKRSLTHINSALSEITAQVGPALVETYTTNDVIILSGCVVGGTTTFPGTATVTAGTIYYNGKTYSVDANASIILASGQIPVWNIATSYISGDPAIFTDANTYDFHKIEKFALTAANAGSGVSDWNASTTKYLVKTKIINIGDWNMDTTATLNVAHGLGSLFKKIKSISVIVRNDADTTYYDFTRGTTVGLVQGQVNTIDSTNIALERLAVGLSGVFDDAAFDSTSYNRGWITIVYGDI